MSQGSQGSFAADGLRLPLSKFSYATVNGESITPIPWIHLGRTNNLFTIFTTQRIDDGMGQVRDLKKFRVLQDPQVLEDIDLDVLAREATRAKTEAQTSSKSGNVPSVTVIVKIPCIAIRYPVEGGQIRRIQMRLANNDDYFETLKILSRANVPFGEAGSFPTQQQQSRPFSPSSSLLRPSDSASQIGARPASVSSNFDTCPSVRAGASAGWASASSLRPTISSGVMGGSPYVAVSSYFGQQNQSSVLEDRTLNAPQSSIVSGYFSGSRDSPTLPPPSRSPLDFASNYIPINLYQPRPSTAPVGETQSISQMLPPRRELPFPKTSSAKKGKKRPAKNEANSADSGLNKSGSSLSSPDFIHFTNPTSDAASNMESASHVSGKSAATVPAMTKKRVAACKTTKSSAPKKKTAKAPSNRASKAEQEEDIVPSFKQLLEESQEVSPHQPEAAGTIDTQALLSRAEATRPHQSIELPTMYENQGSQSEDSAPNSQMRKCLTCRVRKGKCNGGSPCDWCIDAPEKCTYEAHETPASQIQVPSSQPEHTVEGQTKPSREANLPTRTTSQEGAVVPEAAARHLLAKENENMQDAPPQEINAPRTRENRPLHLDATLINATPTTPSAGTSALHLSPSPNPMALLLREPGFANTGQLGAWADLPESVQRETLDTWMCQQLGNPDFIALCKRIDESWQATLFAKSAGVDL